MKKFVITGTLILAATALLVSQGSQSANEALWRAARDGDTAGITAALAKGADVNAKSRYDVTALFFAATSGRLEAAKLLVARGADVNGQETFYKSRAAEMAISNGHTDVESTACSNRKFTWHTLAEGRARRISISGSSGIESCAWLYRHSVRTPASRGWAEAAKKMAALYGH